MPPKVQNPSGSDGLANAPSSIREDSTQPPISQPNRSATSTPTSSTLLPRMSDASAIVPSPAVSQPMSKSNSAGSDPSSKDAGADKASPYGTRSRNKTGSSRPNYAEDKDVDMEFFEIYPERREDETKKTSRQAAIANATTNGLQDAPRTTTTISRRPLPSDGKQQTAQNHSKEPAASSAASNTPIANPTSTSHPSKKRKAASQATASVSQSAQHPHSSTPATTRKSGAAAGQNGHGYAVTNLMTFDDCKARPIDGRLIADDGTVLSVNDHVYLVCEPPGEPYYIARVMEFLHAKNDPTKPVDALRVNWYYRPRDIGRKVQDTRAVFATMHSDISPLTALRGKCQIKHKAEITNPEEYRKSPDCFWFEKLYDRYIQKNYEVIPTLQIVNVPERVKKVLDERWKYILVEQGRGKELTSAVKSCKRCSGFCASNNSVDCAVCKNTYHMNCVRPPLLKKPSRGFAWSCAACSRAQERKLEARNTPNLADPHADAEDEELLDDEDEDACAAAAGTGRTSPSDDAEEAHPPATAEQIYHASLWPYRYLGIHCKVEDALDYDDRIYPRASTRIGPRYQAIVQDWPGRPVEYEKPIEIKKGNRRDKGVQAAVEAEKIRRANRPKWIQDEPVGYVARGEDLPEDDPNCTSQLLYKTPPEVAHADIDRYMDKARTLTKPLDLPKRSTNLEDVAMNLLFKNDFDFDKAFKEISKVDRAEFKEPVLTPAEQKKFEEGVAKYGSELYLVMKHMRTVKTATLVRYYYTWKKTERGKQIWGNYSGRKGKKDKEAKKAENKVTDDVADDQDDSAFDSGKAVEKKRQFTCKFCNTRSSRQWRRAPNLATPVITEGGGKNGKGDKGTQYIVALCRRCAELWRRYAVQWEDIDLLVQKVASTSGRVLKKKVDEDLLNELEAAESRMKATAYTTPDPYEVAAAAAQQATSEPPRKKLKGHADKDLDNNASDSGASAVVLSKKKDKVEKKAPTPVPQIPKPKVLPCAICHQLDPLGDQHLCCRECRLTVHRNCYGVIDNRNPGKWVCDMCANDKSPQISIDYKCVLCPVEFTEHDFVDMPPKSNSKKKTDKEREKEKQEREAALRAAEFYRKRQEDSHRPVNPREPLKRTADNNWVHVTCAVWTPEIKFGKAKALEPSEGIPSIPRAKFAESCKACGKADGACVYCHQCRAPVHVECAHQNGYVLGFDITPVKGSRRDQVNIVSINGESGAMTAAVWCKEHVPQKSIIHEMSETVDDAGMNALQLYVQTYKQADLTLTGCARKANQITLGSRTPTAVPISAANRRASTTTMPTNSAATQPTEPQREDKSDPLQPGGKICLTCGVDSSPKWHPIDKERERELVNGYNGILGVEAQKFINQRNFQCHKCKKLNRQAKPQPPPAREPSPPLVIESLRPLPQTAMRATSPQTLASEARPLARPAYSWSPASQSPGQPHSLQASLAGSGPPVPAPVPQPVPQANIPPALAPRGPPAPTHGYAPAARESFDWHPRAGFHGPPAHSQINGGPPPPISSSIIPPLAPPNHLRPPPISSIAHPPPPPAPLQNGHLSQPHVNGRPPSPRRMSGPPPPPPMTNGAPYMHTYHHPVHHSPQTLTNGGPPPRPPERPYTQAHQPPPPQQQQRSSPFSTPHGSPPLPRDGLSVLREPSNPPQQRQSDSRPASGASANPALRNLLS